MKSLILISIVTFNSVLAHAQEAKATGGSINIPIEQYNQMTMQNQSGGCIPDISEHMNNGISQNYKSYSDRTQVLMDEITKRYEAEKECRNNLAEQYQKWRDEKNKSMEDKALLPIRMQQQEQAYQMEVLKLEAECDESAQAEWIKYKEVAHGTGVLNDPTQAVDFNNKINRALPAFKNACMRSSGQVKLIDAKEKAMQLSIDEMRTKIQVQDDLIEDFHNRLIGTQKELLRNCEQYEELLSQQEALTKQVAEKAVLATKQQKMLGLMNTIAGCIGSMSRQPTGGSDATGTRDVPTDRAQF